MQAAYLAAQDGDTIQIYENIIEEAVLDITPNKTVTIEGLGSYANITSPSTALTLKVKLWYKAKECICLWWY